MVSHEHICLFHCSQSLDKMTQKYIKASLQFQYKQLYKDYKDAKTMDKAETKYHVIRSWWLSSGAATKKTFTCSPSGWGSDTSVIDNGVVV